MGFPGGSDGKASACNSRNLGSIPRSGSSPGEGNGNPLQYSCLENPVDQGGYNPWGCKQLDTTEQLSMRATGIYHFHEGVSSHPLKKIS